jgi:hypothetical protein
MGGNGARRIISASILVLGGFLAFGESGMPDFSSMSDVDLLLHQYEEPEAAMEEYKRRTKDYTPQQVREIEAEFFRQARMPREKIEPTVNDFLSKINQSDDAVIRMKSFTAIQEGSEAAESSGKNSIRESFLTAWAEVPYPAT